MVFSLSFFAHFSFYYYRSVIFSFETKRQEDMDNVVIICIIQRDFVWVFSVPRSVFTVIMFMLTVNKSLMNSLQDYNIIMMQM